MKKQKPKLVAEDQWDEADYNPTASAKKADLAVLKRCHSFYQNGYDIAKRPKLDVAMSKLTRYLSEKNYGSSDRRALTGFKETEWCKWSKYKLSLGEIAPHRKDHRKSVRVRFHHVTSR